MIELRVAPGCGPTGRILERILTNNGVRLGRGGGIVSWGVRADGAHVLNGNAGRRNKLGQLRAMTEAGVQTLQAFERPPLQQELYPLIARQFHHVAGRDIRVCLQPEDAEIAYRNGSNFYTKFIPRAREYRIWVFRKRHLGTYEKILTRPERYTKFGCNYHNGWAFRLVTEANIPRAAVELAGDALQAIGLDFGAVDILVGKDGQNYVLECNSAPGVEGDDRQVIRALARKIANWERNGFLRRNGDGGHRAEQNPIRP